MEHFQTKSKSHEKVESIADMKVKSASKTSQNVKLNHLRLNVTENSIFLGIYRALSTVQEDAGCGGKARDACQ